MKRAFTLIELLVVTAVIAILSSIVFRVTSSADASQKRQETIKRIQRLENCLSGYFAAYGSYPPVAVEGSRNPFYALNNKGNQKLDESPNLSELNWRSVNKACRSQPVMARCPDDGDRDADVDGQNGVRGSAAKALSMAIQELMKVESYREKHGDCIATKGFDAGNENRWINDEQAFRFGLMSYLLPRVLTMMTGPKGIYSKGHLWKDNNNLPSRFSSGVPYTGWGDLQDVVTGRNGSNQERVSLELIPSQAVCRRWISNLEGICTVWGVPNVLFGVDIDARECGYSPLDPEGIAEDLLFAGNPYEDGQSQPSLPNKVTVNDGYGNEFYYYSPPPFQSYRLWSAGENGKTFPPWVTDDQLQTDSQLSQHAKTIQTWIADDIVHMSN